MRNALAAIAACCQGYGVDLKRAMEALETFRGVKRRQELLYAIDGVRVFDDFAHHPTAVRETLAALRPSGGRLWAVFEPRSATACRALHQAEYAKSFGAAAEVLFPPLGRSDIPEAERLDLGRLVADLRDAGIRARACGSVEEIVEILAQETRAGDHVALLSNGAFGGIYGKLEAALRSR
jgi:UDP-N-acetylmuramate: L-alanyl-gamma-D-glutamyl-meso-diaminopimelate ligase